MGYVTEHCSTSANVAAVRRMNVGDLTSLIATRRPGNTTDVVLIRLEAGGPAIGVDSMDATTLVTLGVATRV